jgi:predicted DNA-binding protein (UPF0251 family)
MKRFIQSIMAELEILRERFNDWLEWQDAKERAKFYHPGWLQIAKKARGRVTRQAYKDKILRAYRGECDG